MGDSEVRPVKGDELRLGEFCCDGDTAGDGVLAKGDNGAWPEDFRRLNLELNPCKAPGRDDCVFCDPGDEDGLLLCEDDTTIGE